MMVVLCAIGACWPLALASCTPIAPHAEYMQRIAVATNDGDLRCAKRANDDAAELRRCVAIRAAVKASLVSLDGASDGGP